MKARTLVTATAMLLVAIVGGAILMPGSIEAQHPVVRVDRIHVDKSAHRMTVFANGHAIRTFAVALGRGGLEPKTRQGDGRVPEGDYAITGRNPQSAYYLSLRIGYPTPSQSAAAMAQGIDPGGDIMIHGLPKGRGWVNDRHRLVDWTQGCVAVTNDEINWLWRAVSDGTPIHIEQ